MQLTPLTIGETVLKESDGFDMLGVTFDSTMIFEKHVKQLLKDLVSWGSPCEYSMRDHFLGDAFGVLPCRFLEYCLAVWCPAADTHLKLLIHVVIGTRFLTGCVFEYALFIVDLWQYCVCWISSGVNRCTFLMMLYLCHMCQWGLHAVLWSHIGILMHLRTFNPLSVSLWNDLADPV